MTPHFPAPVPEIPVSDINVSISCYQHNFGFAVDWRADALGLASVSRGDCRIFLANSTYRAERGNVGPVMTWLNMNSNADVDALYKDWLDNNAQVLSVPESKPWGLHEFTAVDPDGNLFRVFHDFGTAARGEHGR